MFNKSGYILYFCLIDRKKVDGEPVKKFTSLTPKYSIYITDEYPPQKFSFEKCIEMHKEAAAPEMTNTLHAQVYADIELDCTTNKKVTFMISTFVWLDRGIQILP
jgi:hypothetical protein